MRRRTKLSAPEAVPAATPEQDDRWPKAGFVSVEHPPMVVLRPGGLGWTEVSLNVRGAYVKYAPTVRASEKAKFNATAARAHYLLAGAIAVAIEPKVVPDATEAPNRDETPVESLSPEQQLRAWFEGVKGPSTSYVAEALDEALSTLSEAGL